MAQETDLQTALSEHPCFNEEAHRKFARMHLPVAPSCNIQCNYCDRRFDCCNESRPGVTSEVLSPEEAVEKVRAVKEKIPELRVIGIAGPGDPMANVSTFETLKRIRDEFPELTLCVSTNGLALPENAERLHGLGVRFVTVTMNGIDPSVCAKVYRHVLFEGRRLSGEEGAAALIGKQLEGIRACVELGMVVKVNVVMIPGINDTHIPDLVKKAKELGVYTVNILPLIPVKGTPFENLRSPTPLERRDLMDRCSLDARIMRHCRQCRADAIGLLGEDRSQEFARFGGCSRGCGPEVKTIMPTSKDPNKFAVASSDGENADSGFGNAARFLIFDADGRLLGDVPVDRGEGVSGESHRRHIESVASSLGDCGNVIVNEIGPLPSKVLKNIGVNVIIDEGPAEECVLRASKRRGVRPS